MRWLNWLLLLALISIDAPMTVAQTYLNATGNPTFGVQYPIEDGFINVANGNLHIEIPLTSSKQRGKQSTNLSLVYDSRIWAINDIYGYIWQPTNLPLASGGWRPQPANQLGVQDVVTAQVTTVDETCFQYSNFTLTDQSGATHLFPFITNSCDNPIGQGYAVDGSGYYASVTDGDDATVYDSQGNEVSNSDPLAGQPVQMDTNGNFSTFDANYDLIDSDARTLATASTTDENVTTYEVLSVGGSRIPYVVTWTTVYYYTQFDQSDVTDLSGSFQAIQSIQLPDGTSYSFTYDSGTTPGHYGELTGITLPTGENIQYSYMNFLDSYQNENRWVSERQDSFGTATFAPKVDTTCTADETGCVEEMKVTKPSGDIVNYTLTLNNGAWNTQTDYYTTNYSGGTSPVMTTLTGYDFTNACDPSICQGAQYIQATSSTTTLNDASLTAQTLYNFGGTPWTGKPTAIQQWDYWPAGQQAPSTPTRETDITYGETVNNAPLPTQVNVMYNGAGFSTTNYAYDQTTPVATSGIVNHQAVSGNRGNLTTIQQESATGSILAQRTYTYNDTGAVLSTVDPNGNTTSYNYDATDTYLTETTRPQTGGVQHVSTAQYDASTGSVTQQVNENGLATNYGYDSLGRPQSVTYPDGGTLGYSYPEPEIETVATRAISPTVSMTQTTVNDAYGRPSQVTTSDPGGNSTVSYTYDANGRVASITNPERSTSSSTDGTTTYGYDWLNRYTTVTQPDGHTVQYSYLGNTATVTDENGNKKEYEYDAFTNLAAVVEPDLNGVLDWETDYMRDPNNAVTSIMQKGNADSSQWRNRNFTYDALGRMIQEVTPEVGTTGYQYDANGNLLQVASPGYTVNYTYDALNRMLTKGSTGISGSGGVNDTYSYDTGQPSCHAVGLLTTATNAALGGSPQMAALKPGGVSPLIVIQPKNSTSYCYDPMGRISQETWSYQNRINHVSASYDYAGDLTQLTYPDSRVITNTYGSDDRLYNVAYTAFNGTSETGSYFTPAAYTPTGQMTAAAFGNGVQLTAGYNSRKSLTSLGYSTATSILWSKSYLWAANATNLTTATDLTGAVTPVNFNYDDVNRVSSVSGGAPAGGGSGGVSETYTPDAWGNLQQTGNFNLNAAYTTANQFLTSDGYTYDGAGDLTYDGSNTYGYDTDGHLILSNGADTYNYGADGTMVYSMTAAAGETDNIYLGNLLVGQYQPGTGSWTDTIYGGGNLIATVGGTATAVPNYRLTDHLGSLAVLTDSSGNPLETNVFVPYGEQLSGGSQNPFLYTSFERESDTGTDRSLTRQYDSGQGRWLTPDLYHGSYDLNDPQTFNRYSYVRNSPLAFTDPSGLVTNGETCDWLCQLFEDGVEAGLDALANGLGDLFGFGGGPTFHGTLQPRPGTNDSAGSGQPIGVPTDGTSQAPYTFYVNVWEPSPLRNVYLFSVFAAAPAPAKGPVPSNGTPQQPQKPPCNPATRIGGVVKAFDGLQTSAAAFTLSGVHFGAAVLLVGAGCVDPTPFEPATCIAGGVGAVSLSAGGLVLGGLGVYEVKDELIPGIMQAITCEP